MLGIFRPDLLANLLLLTYSGSVQLAPANLLGFLRKRLVGKVPVLAGLIVWEIMVIWLTFVETHLVGTWNVGSSGWASNIVVLALAALVQRQLVQRQASPQEAA